MVVVLWVALYSGEVVQEGPAAAVAGGLATGSDREGMPSEEDHIAGCCHSAWGEDHVQGEEHGWVEGVPA